ncbi:MAG: translocation/assembly module TamB domain-containing protein [Chromatiales bacterium]|nr:translocation/assembly module TamB domain-containing protein [Chromatiales bacterium]
MVAGVVSAVLTALFALAVAVALVAGTPLGTTLALRVARDLAGGRLVVTGGGGTLLTGLRADAIALDLGTVTVRLEGVELGIWWPDLLRRQVTLQDARTARLLVQVTPDPDAPDEPVQPLRLPVAVAAESLAIGRVEVQVRDDAPVVLDEVRLTGQLADGDLLFSVLALRYSGIALAAGGRFGTGEPFALDAAVTVDWPAAGVTGEGTLAGSLAELRIDAVLAAPDPVTVKGTALLLDDGPRLALKARATALRRPLDGDAVLLLEDAVVGLDGWLDALRLTAAGAVTIPGLPPARVEADASGSLERLVFERIGIAALGGRITGTGSLVLEPGLAGEFRLAGTRLDPAAIDPRFPGRLDVTAALQFAGNGDFGVTVDRAAGELFARRFSASGVIAREGAALQFDGVQVNAGANRVELDARLDQGVRGRFRVDAPDLASLWPGLHGRLRGQGEVGGTLEQPTLSLDLDGEGVAWDGVGVATLRARGGIVRGDRIDLDVAADGLHLGDQRFGDLALAATGRITAYDLTLRLAGGPVVVDVAGDGGLSRGVWRQVLTAARVDLPGVLDWRLEDAAVLRLAGDELRVDAHCWSSGPARLCLADARLRGDQLEAGAELRDLPLAALGPWLPVELGLQGSVDLGAALRRAGGRVTGSLRLAPRDVEITWAVPDDDDLRTTLTEALLEVEAVDDVVTWQGVVADELGIRLESRGEVRQPLADEPAIAGAVSGAIPDLGRLSPVADQFADIGGLMGSVALAATLSGRLRAPAIAGGLDIADAGFTVPAAGVTVDRINVTVAGGADGSATITGNARSGEGYVQITGDLGWDRQFVPSARLLFRGRQFDVANIPEAFVQVSPDVTAVLADGQLRVGGELLVPRAEIRPKRLGEGAVAPSPDTVVHGREEVRPARGRPFFVLDGLRVRLGRDVRFDGLGLKTDLTGSLTLYQNLPTDPFAVTADGVVQLESGKFTALGQVLTIDRGSLLFSGLVTDPGLDVKASREVVYQGRTVSAGVLLTGTLSRIETKVFSEPAMGEMDALSYITTGKPLAGATTGDRLSVANAALALGMRGAMPVAQKFGEAIRVDELGVEGAGGENTAVFVGETFGENLYVRYSYGIFDQIGTIRVTYRIGRRFSIEGSSGEAQSLYLIYSITW